MVALDDVTQVAELPSQDAQLDAISPLEARRLANVVSHTGTLAAPPELREKLCLLDSGDLLILEGANADTEVLTYRDLLIRNGQTFRVVHVQLAELHDHYGRATGDAASQAASNRQSQVLQIIEKAVAAGATDVHFRVGLKVCEIYHRVHGDFEKVQEVPSKDGTELCSTIYQSMCDVADPTFNKDRSQDGRMKEAFVERFNLWGARVSTRKRDRGHLMVLRLLAGGQKYADLADLGYLEEQVRQVERLTKMKSGIVIFSGATGSGKSTSLQVLVRRILVEQKGRLNVITLEDPPEYPIDGAVQTPVLDEDWEGGIRNLMRLDPDIAMIGEMRDLKSLQGAFRAALTGHGVFTTLHANDATTILQRMDDMGLDQGLALDPTIVTGLINQSLAPTLCPNCKVPWEKVMKDADRGLIERVDLSMSRSGVYARGPGCKECNRRGINGRTVIAEVITPNLEFMRTFRAHGKAEARAYWIKAMHGVSKIEHLARRISEGLIDPADGERAVGLLDSEVAA